MNEEAKDKICKDIVSIMEEYDRQDASGYVDTPGGIEHKGDAFRLLGRWRKALQEDLLTSDQSGCEVIDFPMMRKCDEKAKQMPHFTLLAKDKLSLLCVDMWMQLAVKFEVPEEKLSEGRRVYDAMVRWQYDNPDLCKIPD